MPLVAFDSLPDDARLWVFGSSHAVDARGTETLLTSVDQWMSQWTAHGAPLTCAREWRDGRFLVIGVDQQSAGASGCSIDALFRVLSDMQNDLGASFLGGGRVFYRSDDGAVHCVDRPAFAHTPGLADETKVFDTTVTTAGAYRTAFELPLRNSWHRDLLPA